MLTLRKGYSEKGSGRHCLSDFSNTSNSFQSDIRSLPAEIVDFARKYFACVYISDNELDKAVEFCLDFACQQSFVTNIIASPIWIPFRERRCSHAKIIKYIISKLEDRRADVSDKLFESLVNIMDSSAEFGHRIYLNRSLDKYIVLKERNDQLSQGTTGLSCWQASCDLAHYLLGQGSDLLLGRNVLELGAGCGFAGIAVAASSLASSVTLTDCNDSVLSLINENVCNNFSADLVKKSQIFVRKLDWKNFDPCDLPTQPDLIIASDVIFDSKLSTPLASTIRKIVDSSSDDRAECILASTIRNPDTYATFLSAICDEGLICKEKFTYDEEAFCFDDGHRAHDRSIFPFTSTLRCPTTFQRFSL